MKRILFVLFAIMMGVSLMASDGDARKYRKKRYRKKHHRYYRSRPAHHHRGCFIGAAREQFYEDTEI